MNRPGRLAPRSAVTVGLVRRPCDLLELEIRNAIDPVVTHTGTKVWKVGQSRASVSPGVKLLVILSSTLPATDVRLMGPYFEATLSSLLLNTGGHVGQLPVFVALVHLY